MPHTSCRALLPGIFLMLAGCGDGMLGLRETDAAGGVPTECDFSGTVVQEQPIENRLEAGDCSDPYGGGSFDRWRLSIGEEQDVRIDLVSHAFDAMLELTDAQGHTLMVDDDSGGDLNSRIVTRLRPGTFTLVVRSYGQFGSGAYTLTAAELPACPLTGEIDVGVSISGEVGGGSCLFDMWAPADSFALTLEEETPLRFHLKSAGWLRLVVRDQDRQHVVELWETTAGINSVRASPAAGSYAVFVFGEPDQPPQSYVLTVAEIECGEALPLPLGEPSQGVLEDIDCVRTNGSYKDEWVLEVPVAQDVRIDLTSAAFDPLLVLLDGSGVELARDDDGGPGLDARIDRRLEPGSYRVVASSFSPETGPYTLTALRLDP